MNIYVRYFTQHISNYCNETTKRHMYSDLKTKSVNTECLCVHKKYLFAPLLVKHHLIPSMQLLHTGEDVFVFPGKSGVPKVTVQNSTEDVDRKTDTTWQQLFGRLNCYPQCCIALKF